MVEGALEATAEVVPDSAVHSQPKRQAHILEMLQTVLGVSAFIFNTSVKVHKTRPPSGGAFIRLATADG